VCAVTRGEKENSCGVAIYRDISTLRIIVAEHAVHSNVQQVLREQLLCILDFKLSPCSACCMFSSG
jgi:hypothetical protein